MGEYTDRLHLYKPGGGSSGLIVPDESVDIDKINANMDIIDDAIGALFVTSTTHPSAPVEGMTIYETDLGNLLVYSGSAGRFLPVGIPNATSDAQRNEMFPAPAQGTQVNRLDKGTLERYLDLYNATTNPNGGQVAGWAPLNNVVEIPLVMQGIYKTGGPTGVSYIQNGRVYLEGAISNKSSAPFDGGTPYTFAILQDSLRPATERWFPLNWGSDGTGGISVQVDGTCLFQLSADAGTLGANVLRVSLDGCSWRMKEQ